jgi:hypothetical protein
MNIEISSKHHETDDSPKINFPLDLLEVINQTCNFLKLPDEFRSNAKRLSEINSKVDAIQNRLLKVSENDPGQIGYMSPKMARNYLGMSQNTFDKYRYSGEVRIKGYKLDGKNWYKKSDLDLFMLTYDLKSRGIA